MERVDVALGRIAARQHGLVTRAQARRAGATEAQVRHRLATGRWVAVAGDVCRVAGAPATWESSVMAAVLALGPGALASHRTAAVLWGLDGVRPGRPEASVDRRRNVRRPSADRVHRSTDLHLAPPARIRGIPVTPVGRTLLDLGAVVAPGRLHVAVDDARRRGLVDWEALADVLVVHARRGRPGVAALRALLDAHAGEAAVTDSMFERLVVAALLSAGLPAPVLQHEVVTGGRRFRLDLAYPAMRLAIELDGSGHLRRPVWEADHARQNALVLAGWTILRFTWLDYTRRRPALVAEVRRALAAAA